MEVEERYLDVLRNIETAIIAVYDEEPSLHDLEVVDALDALIRSYTCEGKGRDAPKPRLSERAQRVFTLSEHICEWQLGRREFGPNEPGDTKRDKVTVSEILLCLKRIRSSVRLWNREGGRQGYLDYVSQFLGASAGGPEDSGAAQSVTPPGDGSDSRRAAGQRESTGDTWITDLRHVLGPHDDVLGPPNRSRQAEHLCAIVEAVTKDASEVLLERQIPCRRRPGRKQCPGHIHAGFELGTSTIRWSCPNCGDNGWITGWHGTRWDHGGRGTLPDIRRIVYRRGMIPDARRKADLKTTVLEGGAVPRDILVAIQDNELLGVGGEYGAPEVGDPIQYDELTIEHARGTHRIVVYNRAIMLFHTNETIYVRVHRVAGLIDRASGSP